MKRLLLCIFWIIFLGALAYGSNKFGLSFFPSIQPAFALTGYIDPVGDGTNTLWSSTGTSFYTEIDDGVRQPTIPTTSDYIYGYFTDDPTIYLRMSSISNIQSVSQVVVWIYHKDDSAGQISAQLYDDDETTTRSSETNFTQSTVDAWHSVTFSGLSLTQAQLDSLSVMLHDTRGGGGGRTYQYVYAMYAEITYTEAAAVSISLNTDGTVSFGTQALDSTNDTTSGGINDVETISVDAGPADLSVSSSTFTDGSNTWSLGSTANGSDQVFWEFSPDGTSWSTFAAADTNYSLATNVAESTTQDLFLRLTTPTTTSSYNQHSSTVTITASAP